MLRKWISSTLAVLLLASTPVFAQHAELTIVDKTKAVEQVLYGTDQTGSLSERLTRLEKDIYGTESKDALMGKADKLYTYSKENTLTAPSLITRLNAVEWAISHDQTAVPAKQKLEQLEQLLIGAPATGAFDKRITKVTNIAFTESPEISEVTLFQDTLVKIKMVTPLDTRQNREGDSFAFQASEDVYSNGVLVIAKGAVGAGKVLKVQQARNFGRDAKLDLSFDTLQAFDGTEVQTFLGDKAKEETKSLAKAAGATVAGLIVLGPVGVVGGAFIHGKDVTIPAGAELYIQTKTEASVYGLKVK
ncbi:hypothetical protein [Anaerospora hongkongensis]|uniref:hypothetical protein n=1 Tax=Anaerospora hongkongensis TaxID=244830 RepID=UPI002898A580|nr:hypothetical protein [Anaerospora hongkongensis]